MTPITNNYLKLLIPLKNQSMVISQIWFLTSHNIDQMVYEAKYALADAQKSYCGKVWKQRPRLASYEPIPGYPQVAECVGYTK